MAIPSPEQLRQKVGLTAPIGTQSIPSPEELRSSLRGGSSKTSLRQPFGVQSFAPPLRPIVARDPAVLPSPQELRSRLRSAPVSEAEPAALDADFEEILRRRSAEPEQAVAEKPTAFLSKAPPKTTRQKVGDFFRTTPILKELTEGLFGVPESERMTFEPKSSISDQMTFEDFIRTEEAKSVVEKAQKAAEKRGATLTLDQKEDILDFRYNQEEQETKIHNQGLLGFFYENILKTDYRKIEDRYERLRLAGIPDDRAIKIAIQDVQEKDKSFTEDVRESTARRIAEQKGVPYAGDEGKVEISDTEKGILEGQGIREKGLIALESLDFLGIGSVARKGITTIGEPALKQLAKLTEREAIFKFLDNLFSKVDEVPEEMVNDITDAVYDVQRANVNKLATTDLGKLDNAIAGVLRDSKNASPVTRKAGETVSELRQASAATSEADDVIGRLDPDSFVRVEGKAADPANLPDALKPFARNVVENSAGKPAILADLPVEQFRNTKFETLAEDVPVAGRKIVDPIEVSFVPETKEFRITDGANRTTQALVNGDRTIPAIVELPDLKLIDNFVDDVPVEQAAKVADDATPITEQIRNIYVTHPEANNILNEAWQQMDIAEAGSRFARPSLNREGLETADLEFLSSGSTFPSWIPENLRSKKLFDKVIGGLSDFNNLKYPPAKNTAQRDLYNAVLDYVDKRLGISTREARDGIIKANDELAAAGKTEGGVAEAVRGGTAGGGERAGKRVVPEAQKGTAPASKADDLRTALTNPERVAEEANKAQVRISGTEPDGSRTAAKILDGDIPKIPKTPAKSSRYALKNDPPLEIPDETRLAWLQRKIQDKFNRLNLIQKKISGGKGLPLPDDLNAYLQQEMFYGRSAERIDKFEQAIISVKGQKGRKALLQRMADDGITIDEMGEFLHAKHAPARNARVAELNPKIPDGGSGLTNKQAGAVLAKYEASGRIAKMEEYASEVYEKIVKARLRILETEHLLKPEAVDRIARTFADDTYVPLKLSTKPDIRLRGGRGFDVRGKDVKRLKGSTEAARNNPLIQAIVDYEDAVIKAEKNKVGRTLKRLVEQNPNLTNQQGKKIWEIQAQQYSPVYNEFGEVEFMQPVGYTLADNVMEVRDKGQIFHITMHDKALASAMKNLGAERGVKFLHQINNYLRSVITFYNPEFMITNFERDLQTALINTGGEQGVKAAKDVAKNVPSALRGIWRNTRGKGSAAVREGGIDWAKEYQEMKDVGGRVGWFDWKSVAEKQANIQGRINRASGKKVIDKAAATWDAVAEFVSDVNESVESGVRLSAYVNAKRAGATKEQAASLAKNLTVNFNKKGEWGSAMNSLYLFANAGVQGTARMFKALKHKRTRRIVAGIAAFSYGVNWMNEQVNPEGYDKISDYEKNTNFIFMLPAGVKPPEIDGKIGSVEKLPNTDEMYIKIKLPYGYNIFKVMGDVGYDMSLGDERLGDSMKRLLFAADESFNPLSSGSAAQLVAPTAADPFVQMYENKNFFGEPLRPEQDPYGSKVKESDLYFSSVRQPSKMFTEWLNDVSGGNEVESGVLDYSPENVDHIIDFLGGGVSKFFANTLDTGVSLLRGDVPEINNTPFVRKFVGEVYKDVERGLFYDVLDKSETRLLNEKEIEDFKKYGRMALEEGQVDSDKAKKAVSTMLQNQDRIHAGRILEKLEKADTVEERKQIYTEYIAETGMEKRDAEIKKALGELVKQEKVQGKKPEFGEKESSDSVIDAVFTYAKAIGTDPATAFNRIFTNQRIRRVDGNTIIIDRNTGTFGEDTAFSTGEREAGGADNAVRLDHTIPVQLGGADARSNVKLVPTEVWATYTPVENHLGELLRSGRITKREAQKLIVQFKNGEIPAEEITKLR